WQVVALSDLTLSTPPIAVVGIVHPTGRMLVPPMERLVTLHDVVDWKPLRGSQLMVALVVMASAEMLSAPTVPLRLFTCDVAWTRRGSDAPPRVPVFTALLTAEAETLMTLVTPTVSLTAWVLSRACGWLATSVSAGTIDLLDCIMYPGTGT